MELANSIGDVGVEPGDASDDVRFAVREALMSLVVMLAPFSPHTAEELYSDLTGDDRGMIASGAFFPQFNEELAKAEEIEIPVQVNGKLRSRIFAAPDSSNEVLQSAAFADQKIAELVQGRDVVKVVVVPRRLVNIVVKG
jgi:leucyl-tRNA synthetase